MPTTPFFVSATITAQQPKWTTLDDVWEGTDALRAKKQTYLAQGPAETNKAYEKRLMRARFYNVYRRAIVGLGGILLKSPPRLADTAEDELRRDAENIDGQGAALEVFSRQLAESGLRHGWTLILVDAPPAAIDAEGRPRQMSVDEADRLGIRPYWVHIPATAVRNLRTVVVGGVTVLDQLTYVEHREVPDGPYGMAVQERWRVLTRNGGAPRWEVWVREGTSMTGRLLEEGSWDGLTEIPIAAFYTGSRRGIAQADPPLWELAETNLDHYVVQNEHRHCLHVASVPIPIFTGLSEEDMQLMLVAPDKGIRLPTGATAQYLEHSGAALGQTRQELLDLEARMANQALAMLSRETRAAETAEAKRIDKGVTDAQIAVMAVGLRDALGQAMVFHRMLRGLPASADPVILVNTDFDDWTLEPGDLAAYSQMVKDSELSLETLWELMVRAKRLPESFDAKAEVERLTNPILPTPPADLGESDDDDDQGGGEGET